MKINAFVNHSQKYEQKFNYILHNIWSIMWVIYNAY